MLRICKAFPCAWYLNIFHDCCALWSTSLNITSSIRCYVCTLWWFFVYFFQKCVWWLTIFRSYCDCRSTSHNITYPIRYCCIMCWWFISIILPTLMIVCYVCTCWWFIVYFVQKCDCCLTILRIYCAWWSTSLTINSIRCWWVIFVNPNNLLNVCIVYTWWGLFSCFVHH